jgi:DNA polymerase
LHYIRPKIEVTKTSDETFDGREWVNISYENIVIGKTWGRVRTYGGKLLENIDQAISRDVLAHGMLLAKEKGFEICGSTHDEIISLVDIDSSLGLTQLRDAMISRPTWCLDLPLKAEGFEDVIYRKG